MSYQFEQHDGMRLVIVTTAMPMREGDGLAEELVAVEGNIAAANRLKTAISYSYQETYRTVAGLSLELLLAVRAHGIGSR